MQRGIEPVLWGSVAEEAFGGAAEDVHYLVIAMNTKLLRNNLFILLGYAVLVQLLSLTEKNGAGMMVAMIMMVAVAIHVGVLLFGSLVLLISGKGKEAGQWLLSALLIGVIGFGTCLGGMALGDLYSSPANFH